MLSIRSWVRDSVHGWITAAVTESSTNGKGEQMISVESENGVSRALYSSHLSLISQSSQIAVTNKNTDERLPLRSLSLEQDMAHDLTQLHILNEPNCELKRFKSPR